MISVVLADDDTHMLHYYHAILDKVDNLRIVAATSVSKRVVSLVTEKQPDVVLIDYAMYPIDGFKLMAAIHETGPGIEVILLGGRDTLYQRALDAGAADYLSIPITPKRLVEAVRLAIAR
jgi:DNA-binding NarL/FixJ family response regulator